MKMLGASRGFASAVAKIVLPALAVSLFVLLLGLSVYNFVNRNVTFREDLIAQDVAELHAILKKINDDCSIMNVEQGTSPINFLTVERFVGSQVGPLNLMNPAGWEGPYLDRRPEMQDIPYQLLSCNGRVFIIPGDGVELSNDLLVGRDIVLDCSTDIETMILDGGPLLTAKGEAMAAEVELDRSVLAKVISAG